MKGNVIPLQAGGPRPEFAEELLAALRMAAEAPGKARGLVSRWLVAGGIAGVLGGAGVVAGVLRYQKRRSA